LRTSCRKYITFDSMNKLHFIYIPIIVILIGAFIFFKGKESPLIEANNTLLDSVKVLNKEYLAMQKELILARGQVSEDSATYVKSLLSLQEQVKQLKLTQDANKKKVTAVVQLSDSLTNVKYRANLERFAYLIE